MITGTLRPTEGTVQLRGTIAAILELGMGFNPDFDARQNVLHAGGLLGFAEADIMARMDAIRDFAEIGDYFDQPIRTYSSGMQMRVAFALATAFRPDVLIIDEALSVGDTYFQHKCFNRIRDFRREGTTLIFVSHDRPAVLGLCDRAILLDHGRMVLDSTPEAVMDYYNALIAAKDGETIDTSTHANGRTQTISGSREAQVEDVALFDVEGKRIEVAEVGQVVELRATMRVHRDLPRLVFGYAIKDRIGQTMFGINTHYTEQELVDVRAGSTYRVAARFTANLGSGDYSITTALSDSEEHVSMNYEWRDLALIFSVANTSRPTFDGTVWLPPAVTVERSD
jgi:lipopolysaccharide transport system ATP-binding protein